MKQTYNVYAWKSILFIITLVILNTAAMAQVPQDTVKPKVDTATTMHTDTTKPAQTAPAATSTSANESAAKHKQFDIYAGINSNTMSGSTASYNANAGTGYQIGIAWLKVILRIGKLD